MPYAARAAPSRPGERVQAGAGLRVLEVGERIAGAYAGLILAALGADVCQARHGLDRTLDRYEAAYFDRGRTALDEPGDLLELARCADVLLLDLAPGRLRALGLPFTAEAAEALRPGLVVVAATSLGLEGPHSDFTMEPLTEWAAGGLAYVTRRAVPDDDDEHYTPVQAPAKQSEILGGIAAASAAFAALRLARAEGHAVVADVSRQEVMAAMLHSTVSSFVCNQVVPGSPSARLSNVGALLEAADGPIYFRAVEQHQWDALFGWMGDPDWTREPWVREKQSRLDNWETIRALIGAWTAEHPRQWLYEEGQRHRVPVALPRTIEDVLAAEQPAFRHFWRALPVDSAVARAPSIPLIQRTELPPSASDTAAAVLARWQ